MMALKSFLIALQNQKLRNDLEKLKNTNKDLNLKIANDIVPPVFLGLDLLDLPDLPNYNNDKRRW